MPESSGIPAVSAMGGRARWSVVIPVHNGAHYLAKALPAVVAQLGDRQDAEIVVVDDGSTDDPAAVVRQMGRGRVRYVRNPRCLGAVGTFNRCIEIANGELVHLLHADDSVMTGFYGEMERALADPSFVAGVCRVRIVDADEVPIHVTRSYRTGTGAWGNALDLLAVSNRVRAPGIVVRRSAYERVGGYRVDLPHAADWDMWTRLAAHGPMVFVDRVLATYRRHPDSDSAPRVRTGDNIRERVVAIGVVAGYVTGKRKPPTRKALAYSVVFAVRTALALMREGDWSAAGRQGREAVRCAWMLPRGVRSTAAPVPAASVPRIRALTDSEPLADPVVTGPAAFR